MFTRARNAIQKLRREKTALCKPSEAGRGGPRWESGVLGGRWGARGDLNSCAAGQETLPLAPARRGHRNRQLLQPRRAASSPSTRLLGKARPLPPTQPRPPPPRPRSGALVGPRMRVRGTYVSEFVPLSDFLVILRDRGEPLFIIQKITAVRPPPGRSQRRGGRESLTAPSGCTHAQYGRHLEHLGKEIQPRGGGWGGGTVSNKGFEDRGDPGKHA